MASCKFALTHPSSEIDTQFVCPHKAVSGKSLCIFHDNDPGDDKSINKKFCELVDSANKNNESLVCIGFKLTNLTFPKEIKIKIYLRHATLNDVDFDTVHFIDDVDFSYSSLKEPNFSNAIFEKNAYFILSRIDGKSFFRQTRFFGEANFNGAEFRGEANFYPAYFIFKNARDHSCIAITKKITPATLTYFNMTKFFGGVRFDGSVFDHPAFFNGTYFRPHAGFVSTSFNNWVDFNNAHFDGNAHFNMANFKNLSTFVDTNFQSVSKNAITYLDGANFNEVNFKRSKFDNLHFNNEFILDEGPQMRDLNRTRFRGNVNFSKSRFRKGVRVYNSGFDKVVNFHRATFEEKLELDDVNFEEAIFTHCDFHGEIDFNTVKFPINIDSVKVDFGLATFRRRVRFNGTNKNPIYLTSVSFRAVDLINVEFHNVIWLKTHNHAFLQRYLLIDEKLLKETKDYEDVSAIYNQIRKNYESKLLFSEASHFFVGEMESRRKSFHEAKFFARLTAFYYQIYRIVAWYGESVSLPLAFWSPLIIGIFIIVRLLGCDPDSSLFKILGDPGCPQQDEILPKLTIDSISSFFPIPIWKNHFDSLEHLIGLPILGAAFIALKRKFERTR